jgi:hypothetical protein
VALRAVPRLLQHWGLRPHYPSEAALLEPYASYRRPATLEPLGSGLLGLLLDPLDQWGQETQLREQQGLKRRQNPVYSRLLYLRRRLWAEQWTEVPPATGRWRPQPEEVGLSFQRLQGLLRTTPSRDPRDPVFRRHYYLRHGSLLLLGVAAPPDQAKRWSRRLVEQLAGVGFPGLRPPSPRSSSRPLLFRGFRLRCPGTRSSSPSDGADRSGRPPRGTPRLRLRLPSSALGVLLGRAGLLRWGGEEGPHPADAALGRRAHGWQSGANPALLRHSTPRLLRLFGEALSTTAFYYRGVDNPKDLERLLRRLRGTLLRSLALRYRLTPLQLVQDWGKLGVKGGPSHRHPPLPPLPQPEELATSRPVKHYGRRWQDSRLSLNLEPLGRLLTQLPQSSRRNSGQPAFGDLRRLPRGAEPRRDPPDYLAL